MGQNLRRGIARPTTITGIGLHSGEPCAVTVRPAAKPTGLRFHRTDLPGAPAVPAELDSVVSGDRRTVLQRGPTRVETVEHFLAAVSALALDDVEVDLTGPEFPIFDGSARPYFTLLEDAGPTTVAGPADLVTLGRRVEVRVEDATYTAVPADAPRVAVTIDWAHPMIGTQHGTYPVDRTSFDGELADARTFGFARELDALRARGLIKGAGRDCALVLSEAGLLAGTLRWPDEFVRHKAVDLIGDLRLIGGRCPATITAVRPNHRGNVALARALLHHGRTQKRVAT